MDLKYGTLKDLEEWKRNVDEIYRLEGNKKWEMIERGLDRKIQNFLNSYHEGKTFHITSYINRFSIKKMIYEDESFLGEYDFEWKINSIFGTIIYLQAHHNKICLYDAKIDRTLYFEKYKDDKEYFWVEVEIK